MEDFIEKFEANFEPELAGTFNKDLKFKDLEEWSSMQALIIIAFIDEEYKVTIDGNDIKNCTTIEDLFTVISQRKES